MRDQHPVALFNQRHDEVGSLARSAVLIEDAHMLVIRDQRVAANCDNDQGCVVRNVHSITTLSGP